MDSNTREEYTRRLGENLAAMRKMLNMTQAEMGERLGISRQRLIGYERGDRKMSWVSFLAVIDLLERFDETKLLLRGLGIVTDELEEYLKTGK